MYFALYTNSWKGDRKGKKSISNKSIINGSIFIRIVHIINYTSILSIFIILVINYLFIFFLSLLLLSLLLLLLLYINTATKLFLILLLFSLFLFFFFLLLLLTYITHHHHPSSIIHLHMKYHNQRARLPSTPLRIRTSAFGSIA